MLPQGRVGKTSIINKYLTNQFNDTEKVTINSSFMSKEITHKGQKYIINIWDTAGQEKFNALTSIYYRDAKGVILVYDITQPYSFTRVTKWVEELAQFNKEAKILFVGNKADTNDWKVDQKECIDYAKLHNSRHYFASAKSGMNISAIFDDMTSDLIETLKSAAPQKTNKVMVNSDRVKPSKGCC